MTALALVEAARISPEVLYVLLLLGLFVVPRVLQRYRIPRAITSLGLGIGAGFLYEPLRADPTVELFSTLGIVALFLFAGLEVELQVLRREARVLGVHLGIGFVVLLGTALALSALLQLDGRKSVLVALAVLTPSAGFILESLDGLVATDRERFWIRSKVIATELLALGVLFVTLKSDTWVELSRSAVVLLAIIVVLPALFRLFASLVVPYAPKSEFAFLLMVAVVCGLVTYKLGVYYLVGAFVVGMAAQNFRKHLPAIASEKMLDAVESFASLFVPFYFFNAGLGLRASDFAPEAILTGLALLATAIPLRIGMVGLQRRLVLRETWRTGWRVSVSMLPTLVFTLVLADILRERFQVPPYVFGGLIVYAIVGTLLPTYVLRIPPPEFDSPHAPPAPEAEALVGYGRSEEEQEQEQPAPGGAPVR